MRTATRWTAHLLVLAATALFLAVGLGPHTGAYRTLTVLTGSMAPAIPAGSVVVVRPVAPADIAVGDVVTYNIPVDDRRLVTHRVTDILEDGETPTIVTKGDALEEADPWTTRFSSGPAWKVVTDVPVLGYGLRALQTPPVRRVSVTVLPALFALSWLWRIWHPTAVRDEGSHAGSRPPAAARRADAAPGAAGDDPAPATAAAPAWTIPASFTARAPRPRRVAL